jgi:agmatinase
MNNLKSLLTMPGLSQFGYSQAKHHCQNVWDHYYNTSLFTEVESDWLNSLKEIKTKNLLVLGLPCDTGCGSLRGSSCGPIVLRNQIKSLSHLFLDVGDIKVIPYLHHDKFLNKQTIQKCQKILYGKKINLPVSPLSIAEKAIKEIYRLNARAKIFGIGGDHSTSYPLVKGWLESRENPSQAALIQFDAHTDLKTDHFGINLTYGSWTSSILKSLPSSNNFIQVGFRNGFFTPAYWKETFKIQLFDTGLIKNLGLERTYSQIKLHLKKNKIKEIYISFDIDALDEKYASSTGTPVKDGLSLKSSLFLISNLCKDFKLTGSDIMELAPFIKSEKSSLDGQKRTIRSAEKIARHIIKLLD